jgi:Uma2 family endonuclease
MGVTQLEEPKARLWTREEFYQMLDMGLFSEQRVELLEGEIVEMPAQRNLHAAAIALAEDALKAAFGSSFWVRNHASLDLTPISVLDPDLAVVVGSPRSCPPDNPASALLIVEVGDTTLRFDRIRKASLYARVGIADYWILNLVDRQLEIRRVPVADNTQDYGFRYADEMILLENESATPLAAPGARIAVSDLLP